MQILQGAIKHTHTYTHTFTHTADTFPALGEARSASYSSWPGPGPHADTPLPDPPSPLQPQGPSRPGSA